MDGAYASFVDEALRYNVDPLHPVARLAVECAREAEVGIGLTLAQARDWARLTLARRPVRDLIYLRVERRVQRKQIENCSRCDYPIVDLDSVYVPCVDGRDLGLAFCSSRCADLRLQGPIRIVHCAEAA